jgi:hypothetical protein
MKTCSKCKLEKKYQEFQKNHLYKDGYRNICKECTARTHREYMQNNPMQREKQKIRQKAYDTVKKNYTRHGISEDQYLLLHSKFSGRCWSCKSRDAIAVDHDHECCSGMYSCGKCVRGLLCLQCNTALGLLHDNIEEIKALLEYIDTPR